MQEKEVSLRAVGAAGLWALGVLLVLAATVVRVRVGQIGLACIGGAMVLNIRGYFCRMYERERDVFEMGRDYERSTRLTSLR